jgi:hypothetical protein
VAARPELIERERLARRCAGDEPVDRVLVAASRYRLPRGERHFSAPGADALIPTVRLTADTLRLALREAPLVVVVLIGIFLGSEAWQFFARLDGFQYAKVMGGFLAVIVAIYAFGLWREFRGASTIEDEPQRPSQIERPLVAAGFGDPPPGTRAPAFSRAVVGVAQITRLVLESAVVGAITAALFVILGAIGVSAQLAASWSSRAGETSYHAHELFRISLLGTHSATVTSELLLTCGAIGAIAAIAFAAELVTGERLREEFLRPRFAGYASAFRAWARLHRGSPPSEADRDGSRRYAVATVEDVDPVPWPGGINWHPLRMELGIRAFGANGYTAPAAGETVVEPHTEEGDGRSHEEVYVVLRGRATFTLDGEQLDAPAGTLVFVRDPAVHRQAVAAEPATTVLALGGPPTFEPAGSEWLMRARPLLDTDPDAARALLEAGAREVPESAAIPFGFALLHARAGDEEAARAALGRALAREPRLRDEARADAKLAPLLDA